jgi:hypothetical protein
MTPQEPKAIGRWVRLDPAKWYELPIHLPACICFVVGPMRPEVSL